MSEREKQVSEELDRCYSAWIQERARADAAEIAIHSLLNALRAYRSACGHVAGPSLIDGPNVHYARLLTYALTIGDRAMIDAEAILTGKGGK